MSSGDDLKNKIEIFFQNLSSKIEDKNEVEKLQPEFEKIMEDLHHMNFLTDEDLEDFSKDIETLKEENSKLKADNDQMTKNIQEFENTHKLKLNEETKVLQERLKIMQDSLDKEISKSQSFSSDAANLQSKCNELQNNNMNLSKKYNSLLDEVEINNLNVKKNFSLEKQVKDLSEEKETLKKQLASYDNVEIIRNRNTKLDLIIFGYIFCF